MLREFIKMHGCGNDYIFFDCFSGEIAAPDALAIKLSDRHTGIGGDGIVLICPSEIADAKMRMFNADGSEGRMCGNAIRCVGKYLYESGRSPRKRVTVETLSGIKTLELTVADKKVTAVRVDMGSAVTEAEAIPVRLDGETIGRRVRVAGGEHTITCISMGNPHCVVFEDCDKVTELGSAFENDPLFPERVNTEFVEVTDADRLRMRVWERGSGETMACGTGACAAAAAAVLCGKCRSGSPITVQLPGGELIIEYTPETVFMTGAAEEAFRGSVCVE